MIIGFAKIVSNPIELFALVHPVHSPSENDDSDHVSTYLPERTPLPFRSTPRSTVTGTGVKIQDVAGGPADDPNQDVAHVRNCMILYPLLLSTAAVALRTYWAGPMLLFTRAV